MNDNATVTFLPNKNPDEPMIDPLTPFFSIPYNKIMQAQEFCKNEELAFCFVGYEDFSWHIRAIPDTLKHAIKITENGIHPSTGKVYIYCLTNGE